MIILGFGHKARHGKDTAGEAVLQHFINLAQGAAKHSLKYSGPRVVLTKFATALYKECRELHGMTEKDPILLQQVGMQRRLENPSYWLEKAFQSIPAGTDLVIFTDVRFRNEAEAIKNADGHLIKVTRLNQDGSLYISDDRPADHLSETDLDSHSWDYYLIAKTGESGLLAEQAITLAEYIRGLETK